MKLVESTVEALSTNSERATVVEGLVLLRGCCFDAHKLGDVLDLLGESTPTSLLDVWALHAKTKEAPVRAELFLLFAVLLGLRKHPETQQHQKKDEIMQLLEDVGTQLGTSWLKELIKSLNSNNTARVNAAFCLFSALADIGEGVAARVVDVLKWSSTSGPTKVDFWEICFRNRENRAANLKNTKKRRKKPDPLSLEELTRTPHRDCFLSMVLALLQNSDTVCLLTLLSTKTIMSALLLKLSFDPPEMVLEVLHVLVRRTIGVDADVPPDIKAAVFTPGALCQLVFICGRSGAEAHHAGKLLLELCTNSAHGLLPCRNSTEEEQSNAFRNMMEFLSFLKPNIHSRHWFFLAKICCACPRLAAEYLVMGKINLSAQHPQNFLTAMGVLTDLIKYAGACRMELISMARSCMLPPPNVDNLVDRLIRWCVPPQVNKVMVCKFLLAKSPMVCFGTIACLRRILLSAVKILAVISEARGWETVSSKLALKLADVLPPHSALMKVFWLHYKGTNATGNDLDEVMVDADSEPSSSLGDQNLLLLIGVLGVLELRWKIGADTMPQGSLEALVNVLNEDIVGKDPAYQLAVIHAVAQATKNRGAGYMRTLIPQRLTSILKMLTETGSQEVFLASEKLLAGWLNRFGFTNAEVEGILVWLSLVSGKETGPVSVQRNRVVLLFFGEVLCRMIKNPQALYEMQAELLGDFDCTIKGGRSEVGLICTGMLFNCLQVVFSVTQPSMEKVWISSYVASTVNLFLMSSACPIPLITMIHGLLLRVSHQRASQNGTGSSVDQSKVVLPQEGYSLQSLWLACTSMLETVANTNPAILERWVGEEAGLSISADAFRNRISATECSIVGTKSESTQKTLQDQLDGVVAPKGGTFAFGRLTITVPYSSGAPSIVSEANYDMQTLLLTVSGAYALQFIRSAVEKHPSWLQSQDFFWMSSDVLKGHSIPDGSGAYLCHALQASTDSVHRVSLCLLINAVIGSKELQGNAAVLAGLLERIQWIPGSWRPLLINFLMGALTRIAPCEEGALKLAIALLDALLHSDQLTPSDIERFMAPILSHPAFPQILTRDISGASTESIVLFLKKVILKLKEGPSISVEKVVDAMQNLFGCLSMKYTAGRSRIDKGIARALTCVGPFVKAPLRKSIMAAIDRKRKKKGKQAMSDTIRALLHSFAWLDCGTGLDWKSVGFLLSMEGLNGVNGQLLLEGLQSDRGVDRAVFSKTISLVAIMDACLAAPEAPKGAIAAELVKLEPVCQRMYAENVSKNKRDTNHLLLCLPVAAQYLRGLSKERSKKDVVAATYGSALSELFAKISTEDSTVRLSHESKRILIEFGSKALMMCIEYGGKAMSKRCWSDLLPSLLPKQCWLEKPDEWRMDLLVLSGFISDHQMTKGVVKSSGKALDHLSQFICSCCATFCSLIKKRAKGDSEPGARELAHISALLDGCLGDFLADLSNDHRTSASFDQVCMAAENLAMSVFKYALNCPVEIRIIRRLFASLIPKEVTVGCPDQQDSEMADAGKSSIKNSRALLFAQRVLDALLSHSGFIAAQQPQRPPLSSRLTPGAATLVYPVASVLPVLGKDIDASKGNTGIAAVGTSRTELAVLIETLLDMQTEFGLKVDYSLTEISKESYLMAMLLVGYEASLSSEDIAVLHVLKLLDNRLARRLNQGPSKSTLGGRSPLECVGYLWGNNALELHLAGVLVPRISGTCPPVNNEELGKLAWHTGPMAYYQRSAMTTVYFPEFRTLDGLEGGEEIWGRAGSCGFDGGYDPAFMLHFCNALVDRDLGKEDFWKSGLLALCLRGSAAADPEVRKMGVKVVAKYRGWLLDSGVKEVNGILALLEQFLVAVGRDANRRLPTMLSVFFAEACMQLTSKENDMHNSILQVLADTEEWDVAAVPMWRKFSGSIDQDRGQEWMVKLLAAGMMGTDACTPYERHNVIPALFALHDSKLAHPEARAMAIRVARKATEIPTLAEKLVDSAGLVSWLGDRAVHSGWQLSATSSASGDIEPNYPCAIASIRALQDLVTANIGLGQRGGILNDYIRAGWVLCKMVTNYCERIDSNSKMEADPGCWGGSPPALRGKKKAGGDVKAGMKVCWSENRVRQVGRMWWEVVLYIDALLKVCSERDVPSMADVLEWRCLCDLLDCGDVFREWIDARPAEVDERLLGIVLKMGTGASDRPAEAETVAYWERAVLWGFQVVSSREDVGGGIEVDEKIRIARNDAAHLPASARFLLWLASSLLKGMNMPSELHAHSEELYRMHCNMVGEDQDATMLALLVCMLHLAQPAIEKFKKTSSSRVDMIEKILPEMMSQVGFSENTLLSLWNKSSALGTRRSLREAFQHPQMILSMMRELVGGSTTLDLTEKYLRFSVGSSQDEQAEEEPL